MSNKQKRQLAARVVRAPRQPIPLNLESALGSVLNLASQNDAVKIALSVICDERKLQGKWSIQITAAQLVPVPDSPAAPEGS